MSYKRRVATKKRSYKKRKYAPKRRYKKAGVGYKKTRYTKPKKKVIKSKRYW